jgi:hypothetical protein
MYRLLIGKTIDWLYYEENLGCLKQTAKLLMRRLREPEAKLVPYGYPLDKPAPRTITLRKRLAKAKR